MRILHVVPSFGFGGMEKIICRVIDAIVPGNQHFLVSLDGEIQAVSWIKNTSVETVPFNTTKSRIVFLQRIYSVLRKIRPDLLFTYNWGATDAIWLGRLAGIFNIVHHEHGFNVDESTGTKRRRNIVRFIVYRLASRIVVVSYELHNLLRVRFRVSECQLVHIPNGVDTYVYSPDDADRERIRRVLGYHSRDVVLGFSGRLDPVKNLDLLVDIFRLMRPRDHGFRLLIVGDGPERSSLEASCRALDLMEFVKFVGLQGEVLPYLRAMDVFMLTSLREQMPLTVLEAMAVGVPVIATKVGDLAFMVDHGVNGFIIDPSVPLNVFADSVRNMLLSPDHVSFRYAARLKVIRHFKEATMLERYANLVSHFEGKESSIISSNVWNRKLS